MNWYNEKEQTVQNWVPKLKFKNLQIKSLSSKLRWGFTNKIALGLLRFKSGPAFCLLILPKVTRNKLFEILAN